jgi:hypothetical protein
MINEQPLSSSDVLQLPVANVPKSPTAAKDQEPVVQHSANYSNIEKKNSIYS